MKRVMIGVLLFILAAVSFTSLVAAQDQQEMMKKWQTFMTPGKYHKHLAYYAGAWTYTGKTWMMPNTPPSVITGIVSAKMIMGGRYLKMAYKGESMGMPMEGLGITAYDNHLKRFHSTWIDTMGTGIFISMGKPGTEKVREEIGEVDDPMGSGKVKMRNVFTIISPDSYKMEMFNKTKNAPEYKSMELVFTKKK